MSRLFNRRNKNQTKDKLKECNKLSQMKTSEITNLKFRLTAANNDKIDLLNEIKTKDQEIAAANQNIDSLNKEVSILTNRINAPAVLKEEGFTDISQIDRNTPHIKFDISKSGLVDALTKYESLYNSYFKGYQTSQATLLDEVIPKNEYLSTTDLTGLMYAYTAVDQQNKTLKSQIESTSDEYSTDFQKSKYLNDDLEYVKKINAFMFFGFYILVFIFAYLLFKNTIVELTNQIKIIGIIIVVFYPYWIGYISRGAMFVLKYIGSFIRGDPYESSLPS